MVKTGSSLVPVYCENDCGRSHLVDSRDLDNIESVTCCVCALRTVDRINQEDDKYCSAVSPEMIKAAIKKISQESVSKWTQSGLATHLRIPYYQVTYSCSSKKREEGFIPPKKLVDWVLEQGA